MVAIISGMRAGLNLSSREVLGQSGVIGSAQSGRNGQGVYVNVAKGLLVVQNQDDYLAARGIDAGLLRTYNSKGSLNDDNGDGWLSGMQKLVVTGTVGAAGSTVTRVGADGSAAVYAWDASRNLYVTTEGAGAYDTIGYVAADGQFEWRDGATGAIERYEGGGDHRLLLAADTSGNVLTYAYGSNGFLSSVTTASGETTFYDYTGNNLTQVRTVAGGVTTTRVHYAYDTSNRLTTVTVDLTPADNSVADLNVYKTTYTYDGTSSRVASIQQSDGTLLSFTYVDAGGGDWRVATIKDGLNQTTSFTYGSGYTTVTDPLGLVTRYDYDASAQLTKITAPAVGGASPTRQFTYDANGNVVAVADGESRTVTYAYDANGNQVLQRDQAGNTVTRTFDSRNQLLTETVYLQPDPDGAGAALPGAPQTSRYVYDAGGRNLLRFTVSAEGRVTEHRYNAFGERVASITYAAGQYPVAGLAATDTLAESDLVAWSGTQNLAATQRVDLTYDGRGQLATRTTYARVSSAGAGVADGSQSVQHYVYDQAGLLLQTVSAASGTTTYTYDGLGRVLTATDANNQTTVTQYTDNLGKTKVTLANGLMTTSTYDAAGRLVSVLQSSSAGTLGETKYFYDADNRLRMTQDPTGVRHWMLYDEAGRKTADIDGNGSMTEYTYDRAGLLVRQVAWGTAVSTAGLVDAGGLPVTTVTAASLRPAAGAGDAGVWRQYDSAGRLVREARSTGIGAVNLAAVTDYSYDGASRLVQTTQYANTVTAGSFTGAVAALTVPAASGQDRVARRFYDADGRLAGSLDAEGYLTAYRYTAAGQLAETVAYATVTNASLRASGTLAQLLPASAPGDIRTVTLYDGKGQPIAQVDGEGYLTENAYDADGNLTLSVRYASRVKAAVAADSLVDAIRPDANPGDRSTQKGYDALGRLQFEITPEGVRTDYAYDSAGNLVSTVRAAATSEARTFLAAYDLQGRLTGELSAEGAALLTGGQTQAQIDAIWAQYGVRHAYDAAGRRISTTDAAGNKTLFFYDADGALSYTVNALGEVQEQRYDARGRLTDSIRYVNRISLAGLVGGLTPAGLTAAVAAAANAAADGHVTYTYTRDSEVASSTDEVGTVTTQAYDVFGDAISRQVSGTAVNFGETYTVDRRGQRTGTLQDAGGLNVLTSSMYDAFGRLVRSIDGNGNVREQVFDRLGRVVTQRDPLNALRTTSYDAFGRVLTQTDELGKTTSYAYDAAARTTTVTTPEGIVTVTAYTRHGQVLSITDGKGQVTSYTYDRDGRLKQTSTPLTSTSSSYDGAGRLVQTIDAAGNQVAYTYDAANRVLTRRVDPAGLNLTTAYQYDGKGQQVSVTDPNGVVTTRQFDRKGQVLRQTVDPTGLNLQTVYTYDARGNALTVISPGGSVTQYAYDTLGRRTQEKTAVDTAGLFITRSWTYDRNGNAVSSTDGNGNVTRYAYDADDRLVFTVDPLGGVQQNTYDAAGRVVKTVAYATPISLAGLPTPVGLADIQPRVAPQAAQDRVQHRVYDGDGRLTFTIDGTGAVVRYTYDANGNVVARTGYAARIDLAAWTAGTEPAVVADSAHDAVARTVYDALDRAIYSIDGVGAVVAQVYDGNGNVLQRTAYATAIPVTTAPTASAIGAAVAAVANAARDASVRNTYDAAGRLTWSVDGVGAVTQRTYDGNGNVVKLVAYATPIGATAAPSSVTAGPLDRSTAMAYDAANRLVFQVDATRAVTEQVYDADGNVLRRTQYATAIATVPALGIAGTVAAIRAAIVASATADRTVRYGYDLAGRQVLAIDAMGSVTATQYDAVGHVIAQTSYATAANTSGLPPVQALYQMQALVVANSADRTTRHAYDAAGRLVYEVDALGHVTGTQRDALGQVTRTTRYWGPIGSSMPNTAAGIAGALHADARDQTDIYTYNAAGLRITATDALGGTESYTYDALGRKLSFVNKSHFTWTYAYDAAGRMTTETTPQVSLTSVTTNGAGNLVAGATASAAIVTRLAYDALGNLVERTEALGRAEQRTTRYEYDALGRQVRVIYPPVGVYNAAGDSAATNGATGVATRVETTQVLETRTIYDALGNAVAGVDVGGALSQKVYDLMGRVLYEVDAMGYVTGYTRNAFGEVTSLLRYAAGTTLANGTVTQASQAATKAQVESVLNAAGFDHSRDRVLLSSYDRAGRVVETREPDAFVSSVLGSGAVQTGTAGKTTRNTWDAFGQLVQSKVLSDQVAGTWATTTHYYNALGREEAVVDALGYLTTRIYDAMGNVTEVKEFATAVAAGWGLAGYVRPLDNADDRTTAYAYDALNRKIGETRKNVEYSAASNGTSTRGDLATTYAYDAVGNQTVVTDANGKSTYTYYDALGRITAVAAPGRSSTPSGTTLVPLTEFRRDAYGNVLVKIERANGAASATATGYTAGADSAADRTTLAAYDSFGRAVQSTNANGASEYTSYDAWGHVAKHWQGVTGNDGVTRTAFELDFYDKLGHLVESRTPASTAVYGGGSISVVGQGTAGVVSTAIEYNAFGEVTRKGVQGGRQEYFDYDNAGRLWRTNTGDGVDRIYLYDVQGNQTSEIRSSGAGGSNSDIKAYASAQSAAADPYTRRVDIRYDLMGRVTARTEAARQELQGGVGVHRQFVGATVALSAQNQSGESSFPLPSALNRVNLSWNSLSALGSGDVKVYVEYLTPVVVLNGSGENSVPIIVSGGTARSFTSGVLNGDATAGGATLEWTENPASSSDVGVGRITRVVVYKKDVAGNWQVAVDQGPGYGSNDITVATPPDPNTAVTLELRAAGTTGSGGWWTVGLVNFGSNLRFDARSLPIGSYEYRVTAAPANESARVIGTGTMGLSQPPLNSISADISSNRLGLPAGVMTWSDPGAGYEQVLRFRASGSTGAWSTLSVGPWATPWPYPAATYSGVDTRALAAGSYQYELIWTTGGVPVAHATGNFNVVAAVPAQWVPPVNLPNITGVAIGTGTVGGTIVGYDESHVPIYSGGTTVPALQWSAAGATVARYRASPSSAWNYLTIDSSGQSSGESGYSGIQKVLLNGIPPGTYQFEILTGSPATAQATANVTIYPQGAGWYETVNVQVPVRTPVILYYTPVYETRYGTRSVPYSVWVNDPPYQYVGGYDEAGRPIYYWAYPGHYETRYYTETYSYQVQVGQAPFYARDESGNIIYQTTYTTQTQQVWHAGTTPTPTRQVTTPPYTAGYWTQATPVQYGVSVSTTPGSTLISGTDGAATSQSAGLNGDNRMLRPTVYQTTDRWGNVLEVSDPRSPYWKTTYKYNANNQLVQQKQPDVAGAQSSASPVTTIYYDQLGRQVAVKDANGNVNGQVFDAGGNLVQELHADGGVVTHSYNAFGDKVRTADDTGRSVGYTYDKMGHVLSMAKGVAGVYSAYDNWLHNTDTRNITDSWTYDQLGRKLTQTNGNGETVKYTYDLRGNVIETWQPLGQVLRNTYDAQGRKTGEVDANGAASTWTYDYFGQLRGHVDMGGATYYYAYDNARQLTAQSSTRGQSITYTYDAAGQVTVIQDWALNKVSTYAYDLGGRKLRERVTQAGITYQDNHLAYDAQGNLRDVADARAHVVMEYDKVGNRTRVSTYVDYQGVGGEALSSTDRYFKYDAMNRQIVVDAVNAAGDLGGQGHQITYDHAGNRTSDTYWGPKVTAVSTQTVTYDESSGAAIYSNPQVDYVQSTGYTVETYAYDNLNRLKSVSKDGTQIDLRFYDGADRVVASGPVGMLPQKYAEIINAGLSPDQMNGKETRVNRYDANGRLLHQKILKSDGAAKVDISWDSAESYLTGWRFLGFGEGSEPIYWSADGYDAAGNALGYIVNNHDGSEYFNEYSSTLGRYEGYKATYTSGASTKLNPGNNTQTYDANGYLVGITDATQGNNNRTFVNDANGVALYVNQAGNVQRQLVVKGEVLGIYGARVNPSNPSSGYENNPNFANVVDFDFGYSKISANYPNATPGAYTVKTGDTLQSMAQSAYGDSSLWYRIAEANGLGSSNDLKVGQTLNIPNRVSTINNNGSTFKPYDPSEIEGDKTPNLSTPKPKKGSWFAQLLMVIVVVVATIFTAGLLAGASGSFASIMSAGASALGGAATAGVAATIGPVATGAIAGAAGSLVGQIFGVATGLQDSINWKGVALGAISAGVTSGLGAVPALSGNTLGVTMARVALGNAVTQGIGVALGLQNKFDWRSVAASAVGAGVGQVVGEPLTNAFGSFGGRLATGLIAGAATAAMRGGKVAIEQVAIDAFGNALGSSIAESANGAGPTTQGFGPSSSWDHVNGMDLQSDQAYEARRAQEWIGQSDAIQDRRLYENSVAVAQERFRATEVAYRQSTDAGATSMAYRADDRGLFGAALRATSGNRQQALAVLGSWNEQGVYRVDRNNSPIMRDGQALPWVDVAGMTSEQLAAAAQRGASVLSANTATMQANARAATLVAMGGSGAPPSSFDDEAEHAMWMERTRKPAEMRAIKPGVWEQVYGSPDVQRSLNHGIVGPFIVKPLINLGGKINGWLSDDRYDFAQLRHLNPVESKNAGIDVIIGTATALVPSPKAALMRSELNFDRAMAEQANAALRSEAAANIREARNILRDAGVPVQARNEIIRSFEAETFRVERAASEQTALRVFDDSFARLEGRYVSPDFFSNQTDRIRNFALMKNSATRLGEVTIPEGSVMFTGRVAAQPVYGPGLTGGANQIFLTGPLSNYGFREVMLPR
ncbi:LysM peptidoglycan-binding domain-containing protein [Ramlibacter humi]|uniref:LysM peptidoglycan-binding domain-containing protein n=1 Tax=Ramlibacter humi TaxID=2530451 RepID=A0A4Z0BFB2_9BURK|nr:LysM peptidoglycan-binding domain-containing protein [Ramlibacter humi]TFY97069.1 LysM peptidoglycan-binding domain-containing protein [Ramlibacter humi]